MQTQPSKTDRILLIAAWVVVLLSSALPKIILQELFNQTVTWEKQAMISLGVALIALLATFAWRPLRGLRPLLTLLIVLVGSQWLIYHGSASCPFFKVG